MTRQQEDQLKSTKLRIEMKASINRLHKITDRYVTGNAKENLRYAKEVGRA